MADVSIKAYVRGILPENKDIIEVINEINAQAGGAGFVDNFVFIMIRNLIQDAVNVGTEEIPILLSTVTLDFKFTMTTANFTLANLTSVINAIKSKFFNLLRVSLK